MLLHVTTFQFHKVRLKDIADVSNMVRRMFQFHKVRLKAVMSFTM